MRSFRVVVAIMSLTFVVPPSHAAARVTVPARWRHEPTAFERMSAVRGRTIGFAEFESIRRALLVQSAPGAAVADPEFVFPYRAGDLDGDGKDDVLTFEFVGETATLNARRGTDGSTLWSMPGAYFARVVDLFHNGQTRILTLSAQTTAAASGITLLQHRVSLVRGNGSVVWSYVVPGASWRFGDQESGGAVDVEAVAEVRAIPDATGDGVDDVWVGSLSVAQVNESVFVTAQTYSGRTVEATTGLQVGTVPALAKDAIPWVVPSADVSGDGLADAFSFGGPERHRGFLAAHSVLGPAYWTDLVPTNFAYMFVYELTGDGKPDVMLQAFIDGGVKRLGYSGANGAPLWSRADLGYIDAGGDIDGDGATDMIQVEAIDNAFTVRAWSGATGKKIWGPLGRRGPGGSFAAFCFCTDDLNGDHVWDPLTAVVEFTDPPKVTVWAFDGAGGALLWRKPMPFAAFPSPLGADADGDGIGDVALAGSNGAALGVSTYRGSSFAPIWSASAPSDAFPIGFYGDDLISDGRGEVIVAAIALGEESFRGSAHAFDASGRIWSVP